MIFEVFQLPAFDDNYIYILNLKTKDQLVVVDPGDPQVVIHFLKQHHLTLNEIWITHHHFDHIDGLPELKKQFPDCLVRGPQYDEHRISPLDVLHKKNDTFLLGDQEVQILYLPGHTLGHIAYYIPQLQLLFSGDVIFSLGCGRLFEGSHEQMHNSLKQIEALPDDTQIFCTHEYTLANIEFLKSLEKSSNEASNDLQLFYEFIKALRDKNIPTVPTTVKREKQLNPFLTASTVEEFKKLRLLKDQF